MSSNTYTTNINPLNTENNNNSDVIFMLVDFYWLCISMSCFEIGCLCHLFILKRAFFLPVPFQS